MFTNPEQYQESMRYLNEKLGYRTFSSWRIKENVFRVKGFDEKGYGVWKVYFDPNELATVTKVKKVG